MPAQVIDPFRGRGRVAALVLTLIMAALVTAGVLASRPAGAQTAGPQVTQFPGASVDLAPTRAAAATLTTSCPAGFFAMAGGWSISGPAATSVVVTTSAPTQLPGGGLEGQWTLVVVKPAGKGAATVTPYVSCLGGIAQLPE